MAFMRPEILFTYCEATNINRLSTSIVIVERHGSDENLLNVDESSSIVN